MENKLMNLQNYTIIYIFSAKLRNAQEKVNRQGNLFF